MKNPKNAGHQALGTIVRSIKGWRLILALVLVAPMAALFAVGPTPLALADEGGVQGHTFHVTFTKWITAFPNMVGVVGGDVGVGPFAGEILNIVTVGTITKIEAIYHMNGSRHSFTAHVFVTQDNVAGMAAITGRVTEGWLEGALLTGQYKVWATCPIATPDNGLGNTCFQGTLQVFRGSEK